MSLKNLKPVGIALVLSLAVSILVNMLFTAAYSGHWYFSILFHVLISILIQLLMLKKADDQKDYVFRIMFVSMGRLLLCMIALLVYKLALRQNFTQFAVHFMLHYILFTVFEIAYLLKFIKAPKND